MTETYHIYGFGVELSQLGEISLERLEQLIDMAPIFKSKILKWFEEEKIDIISYGVVNSIKITFPRKNISGSLADNDIYGCQQHMPLANIVL